MIVLSEERYLPTMPGIVTLQDSDGVYYYVHKTLYEQAVIIEDRYGESIETLQKLIGGHPEHIAIQKFIQYVPRPVGIMGYFLALLSEDVEDFEDAVGALDAISSAVNLRNLIKQPEAIRQTISFGMSVKNEYRDSWERFFQSCYLFDSVKEALNGNFKQPVQVPQPTPYYGAFPTPAYTAPAPAPEPEEEEEDDEESDPFADFLSKMDDISKSANEKIEASKSGKDAEEVIPESEKAPLEKIPESLGGNGLETIAKARRRAL